jgi:hypothetical protein
MQTPVEIIVTYADYRQGFVAEQWLDNVHLAELYEDGQGGKHVELFFVQERNLALPLDAFQDALQRAKYQLWPPAKPQ